LKRVGKKRESEMAASTSLAGVTKLAETSKIAESARLKRLKTHEPGAVSTQVLRVLMLLRFGVISRVWGEKTGKYLKADCARLQVHASWSLPCKSPSVAPWPKASLFRNSSLDFNVFTLQFCTF
jgi:hypothetical protein